MSLPQPSPRPRFQELEDAARKILAAVGEDVEREGLEATPRRVARALLDLTGGYDVDIQTLVRGALYERAADDPVTVRDIPFYSLCEHHMLPMFGRCHVGYVPSGRVIGLSKLPRIVDAFAHRLQLQERMTREIAEAVEGVVDAKGVAVVMEARHLCVEMRGVEKHASETVTSSLLGVYLSDAQLRAEFMNLVQRVR
ncbi:MAG TPA: GTP cyclohydrolase I FolE [Candidatus Dormibacteraeota bacterium]|nr:GTP cyclohydrolase I FolE [Candidatus Dormibacteraeota bacterium]